MTKISRTIIFFGTDDFSLVVLEGLINAGYDIAAVVTKPDHRSGRGHLLIYSSVKKFAIDNNMIIWQPTKIADINKDIQMLGENVTGVLASFGKLIPESTIKLFNPGIINIHPSLLPKYRGPSPIESVIKNGDEQTGVTIMKLATTMDTGPIYGQTTYKLSKHETSQQLRKKLSQAGSDLLVELMPSILDESLIPIPQNDKQATYCQLITKDDAWLKPNEVTADQAERIIRAFLGYPKTKITIENNIIIITKAHAANKQTTQLDILCSDNNYLAIDQLVAPSGHTMTAHDFINGYLK
jgi:methionyl-tRNA formyltransferase